MTSSRFLLDTSCLIPVLCGWHENHHSAVSHVERLLGRGEKMVIPSPVLAEAYAVLTRLPAPHRLSPEVAYLLLEGNFKEAAESVALSPLEYWETLQGASSNGVSGGRFYDSLILACARKARAKWLLTFNKGDFEALGAQEMKIVVPG